MYDLILIWHDGSKRKEKYKCDSMEEGNCIGMEYKKIYKDRIQFKVKRRLF